MFRKKKNFGVDGAFVLWKWKIACFASFGGRNLAKFFVAINYFSSWAPNRIFGAFQSFRIRGGPLKWNREDVFRQFLYTHAGFPHCRRAVGGPGRGGKIRNFIKICVPHKHIRTQQTQKHIHMHSAQRHTHTQTKIKIHTIISLVHNFSHVFWNKFTQKDFMKKVGIN